MLFKVNKLLFIKSFGDGAYSGKLFTDKTPSDLEIKPHPCLVYAGAKIATLSRPSKG